MDRAERNELVEKNIGLVHACANKFRGKGAEYDDLFQAGCVGIIKAAENFDGIPGHLTINSICISLHFRLYYVNMSYIKQS